MQKEAFGKLLIILRKKNGLSQKELEEKKHMYRCLGVAAGIFVILILV